MRFIQTKVSLMEEQADGTEKKVSKIYLVDADDFSEAEVKICGFVKVEEIQAMKFVYFDCESLNEDDFFFKATAEVIMLDEATAKEKKQKFVALIQSDSLLNAGNTFRDMLDANSVVKSVFQLAIEDVIINEKIFNE